MEKLRMSPVIGDVVIMWCFVVDEKDSMSEMNLSLDVAKYGRFL